MDLWLMREQADEVENEVNRRVTAWAKGKDLKRMLVTLHLLLPKVVPRVRLGLVHDEADVRRAYKQALRKVHPDKLSSNPDLAVADRLAAQRVFSILVQEHRSTAQHEQKQQGHHRRRGQARYTTYA